MSLNHAERHRKTQANMSVVEMCAMFLAVVCVCFIDEHISSAKSI